MQVALNPHVATVLIGPGADRLQAIEERTRRRFFLDAKDGAPPDHFEVTARGPLAKLIPESPVEEGQELSVKPVEVGRHDPTAGIAKVDGIDVCVARGARLVGKRAKVRITRVLDGTAYAEIVERTAVVEAPITAEAMAEKPTRQRRKRAETKQEQPAELAEAAGDEPEEPEEPEAVAAEEAPEGAARPKKRTRRGSRGGRRRKKKPAEETAPAEAEAEGETAGQNGEPAEPPVLIHLPDRELGEEPVSEGEAAEPATDGAEPRRKKRTRRGSRGGRRRRKPAAQAAADGGDASETATEPLVD